MTLRSLTACFGGLALSCALGCSANGSDDTGPGLGSSGSSAQPGCSAPPDCGKCGDCFSLCMCSSAPDPNMCSSVCGVGSGGNGGGTGGSFGGSGGGSGTTGGTGGSPGTGGVGVGGTGGGVGGTGGSGTGTCCPSGDCICRGPNPTGLTSTNGPYKSATFTIPAGTVHYPTDAEPPFSAISICPGFTNTGPEMAPWGAFYSSHGIVTVVTSTLGGDVPDIRATKLLAAITQLKEEQTKSGSPLFGKLAGRYGTSGYSMGGGGTTIAAGRDATLKTSIGLAAWGGTGTNVRTPTLLLCGSADTVAPCSMSQTAYTATAGLKMMVTIAGATHFNWFGPTQAGGGVSGETALAFQKVYLDGDERWKPLLLQSRGTKVTTIQ